MIRKVLLAACAAFALAAPARAQFVYYPGWFKTMPNGSTLTDTGAGVFSFAGGGNTFTITAGASGTASFGGPLRAGSGFTLGITGAALLAAASTNGLSISNSVGGAGFYVLSSTTVSALPTCSASQGYVALATDSTVAASGNYGAAVVGGSNNKVKVYCDGTSWKIG